jgi:hypothetical protein
MKSLTEVMKQEVTVPTPDEMEENSKAEFDSTRIVDDVTEPTPNSKESLSHGQDDVHVYAKADNDSRYVVRVGTILAMSIGSAGEGYGLKRLSVWSPQLENEVFNDEQVAKGKLELLADVPTEVTSTINRTLSTLNQVVDALGEHVY